MQSIYELREGTAGSTAALMAPLASLVAGTASADARLESTLTAALARGLEALSDTGRDELESIGLSRLEARRLQLCARLARAIATDGADQPAPISGPADVLAHVQDLRTAPQERAVALYLDARNRPLGRELVSVGGLRASVIQPRDVLAPALRIPAAALILVHNHPSGDCTPSAEDIQVTRQLAAAAQLLGLELLDHLVVSARRCASLRELGHL
jgi:DNA repair protein RadC